MPWTAPAHHPLLSALTCSVGDDFFFFFFFAVLMAEASSLVTLLIFDNLLQV